MDSRKLLAAAVLIAAPFASGRAAEATPAEAASDVIRRVFGVEAAARFTFAPLPADASGNDRFEYSATGGRVLVRGTSPVAMTRGAYEYLKANGLGECSWSATRIDTDKPWPDAPVVRGGSPVKYRYYFNVVTYGYTMPYWTWERWERELDWMALHGMNLPLALTGQEAIEERVWRRLGLTQPEIDASSSGAAFLPWQRMGNIAGHDGPLRPSWHADQLALRHRILGRMRALGITPIRPAFAGFVPRALEKRFPDVAFHHTAWGGFPDSKRATFVPPDDPLFAKIAAIFDEEWTKEFGREKFRLADSFNEMQLPQTGRPATDMLADYGKKIHDAVVAGNPDAVWVMQGWMIGYEPHIWTPANLKALLSRVPDDGMLILDLAADYNANRWGGRMNYDKHSGFHGKPWVFSVIPNMGGKTYFTGVWDFYASGFAKALASPNRGRLVGGGIAGEGIETNELLHEIVADSYWRDTPVDLDTWLPGYARARYGDAPTSVVKAWQTLRHTCDAGLLDHPSYNWQVNAARGQITPFPKFYEAAADFLADGERLKSVAAYRADAAEFAAMASGMRADEWVRLAYAAQAENRPELRDHAVARALDRLAVADRLLESHPTLRLENWIGFARSHPGSGDEQNEREHDARRIVTVWGPPINDYSCRLWSGLIRDFYAPRLKARFAALAAGTTFDRRTWEERWVKGEGVSPCAPYPDIVDAARDTVRDLLAEKIPPIPEAKTEPVAEWSPETVSPDWKTVELPITGDLARRLRGIRFDYVSGAHALEIRRVALVADGHEVAVDAHDGLAGKPTSANRYKLRLPAGAPVANDARIIVVIRGKVGVDSHGAIKAVVE